MGRIQTEFQNSENFNQFLDHYLDFYMGMLQQLKGLDFAPLIDQILKVHREKKKVIIMGNGGSAANATHISTGLSYITRSWDSPIKSMSLANDSILLTSLGNDFSYEDIFYRQLQVHLEPGDLVIALSVSGNSKNVVKAAEYAQQKGNCVIGLVGSDGGRLKNFATHLVHIKAEENLFGVTEDVHMVLGHALTYYLEYHLIARKP